MSNPNNQQVLSERDLINKVSRCPDAGKGVHRYLFRAACELWKLCDDPALIARVISEKVQNCGREVDAREIEDAVDASSPEALAGAPRSPGWPKPNDRRIEHVIRSAGTEALEALKKCSPFDPTGKNTEEIVDLLFPGDPLLCFATDQRRSLTRKRSEWRDFSGNQFMVPSRMTCEVGKTKSGARSMRCLDNTGDRDYLVVEFDSGTQEEQAAKILHLAEYAPLTMVVFSGGKSLHSWFRCTGNSEEDTRAFMAYAVSLGADPSTWVRCQLVRAPAATRDNGMKQTVLFFNPTGEKIPGTKLSTEWRFEKLKAADSDLLDMEVLFDPQSQRYLFPAEDSWIPLAKDNFVMQLVDMGYRLRFDKTKDRNLSPVKQICSDIQRKKHILYAAPLAGYDKGRYEFNGDPVLVTKSPKRIVLARGEHPVLKQLFENQFAGGADDQRPYVHGWLRIALEAHYKQQVRPGQALVLAGEANCGKSFLQSIVTELLGGRSAKPFRYMAGLTPFNSELFEAEHLIIEDEASSFNTIRRVEFGTRIKEITVNQSHSCHPKGRKAVTLNPFWRLSISLNDEPEHLQILPPLDDSMKDKLMLLKVRKMPMPMPTQTPEERRAFREKITSELPSYIWWLLNEWSIPPELLDERYGIKTFHNRELCNAIENLGPEIQLLEHLRILLRSVGAAEMNKPLVITAAELTSQVQGISQSARPLLSWTGAMGTYLSRLAKKFPDKIKQSRTASKREWEIARDV